jgi:hypothetical protein
MEAIKLVGDQILALRVGKNRHAEEPVDLVSACVLCPIIHATRLAALLWVSSVSPVLNSALVSRYSTQLDSPRANASTVQFNSDFQRQKFLPLIVTEH